MILTSFHITRKKDQRKESVKYHKNKLTSEMADSEKASEQQSAPAKTEGAINESATNPSAAEEQQPKQIIAEKVSGTVKWFNVKSGYGFINRHDTKEDVFVHQTAIVKNNPKKSVRSVGDGEPVEFDVVLGDKGNEAANVTGPNGEPVQGSPFAPDKRRGRLSYRPRRRTQRSETGGETGDGEGNVSGDGAGSDERKPRQRRFGRGRRFGGGGMRGGGGFRRGPRRNGEDQEANGEGTEGNTAGESGGENDGNNQNGRVKRLFPRRRNFNRRPRKRSETNADGAQNEGDGNNENGQKPRPRRNRRFNRKPRASGSNQDGGQEVQNTVTESTA